MNQCSTIGFGTNAQVLAGYALAANDRLGNIDLIVENTGKNSLYFKIAEHDGVTSPSGYRDIITPVTIVAGGNKTISLNLLNKQIGFFGSGPTTANVSTVIRNPANLAGRQIDIVAGPAHQGWGFSSATDVKAFRSPGYPPVQNFNGAE